MGNLNWEIQSEAQETGKYLYLSVLGRVTRKGTKVPRMSGRTGLSTEAGSCCSERHHRHSLAVCCGGTGEVANHGGGLLFIAGSTHTQCK